MLVRGARKALGKVLYTFPGLLLRTKSEFHEEMVNENYGHNPIESAITLQCHNNSLFEIHDTPETINTIYNNISPCIGGGPNLVV